MANKEQLYKLYSDNLEILRTDPRLKIPSNESNIFVCPMCLRILQESDLQNKQITPEHIPPQKLGGKARTLTCKECNNWAGSELDSQLVRLFDFNHFLHGKSNNIINMFANYAAKS
jgi:hypothetical protein